MNETTKYKILNQREMMKGYTSAYVTAQATDQQQKLPFPAPLKDGKGTARVELPLDFEDVVQPRNLFELIQNRESCRVYRGAGTLFAGTFLSVMEYSGNSKICGNIQTGDFPQCSVCGIQTSFRDLSVYPECGRDRAGYLSLSSPGT